MMAALALVYLTVPGLPLIQAVELNRIAPDLVWRFRRVMKKAMDDRIANLDRSIELIASFLGVPLPKPS